MKRTILFLVGAIFILLGLSSCKCDVSIGGGSELKIGNIDIQKKPVGDQGYQVEISFEVLGFEQKEENGKFNINLVQDLETRDPKKIKIDKLTRLNFKRFSQTIDAKTDLPVTFTNTLTIPVSFGTGDYEIILTVNDQNSGKSISTNANFTLDPLGKVDTTPDTNTELKAEITPTPE